ncbi:MAG: hypothetical protein IPO07_31180 [Haliscomenobacter sp.]|nr:hypothetical protein [Haliscomenobacter sp.]MBK9492742.1 hypothetical protein [Haliscomenobacter sp.]
MGAVLVKKVQAEPETTGGPLQWIASGKTVLNNKGKPVKQYEPYFSKDENKRPNHRFEEPCEQGVTPILYYDAPGRQVRVEMPDGTLSRVEFSPWFTRAYDANDTVMESRWFVDMEVILTGMNWVVIRQMHNAPHFLAKIHAGTPTETHLDSLGREVLSMAHNRYRALEGNSFTRKEEKHLTYTHLDAEGKSPWIRDARASA